MNRYTYNLLYIFVCIFFLPSCKKDKKKRAHALYANIDIVSRATDKKNTRNFTLKKNRRNAQASFLTEQEAKFCDIPVPLRTVPVDFLVHNKSDQLSDSATILSYESMMSVQELVAFFVQQMELLDWRLAHSFYGVEILLVFASISNL